MKCPKCGSITKPDNHVICLACGIDMTDYRPETVPEPPKTKASEPAPDAEEPATKRRGRPVSSKA